MMHHAGEPGFSVLDVPDLKAFLYPPWCKLSLTTLRFYNLLLRLNDTAIFLRQQAFMANSLKINVFLIPEEGRRLAFSEGGDWFRGCFQEEEIPDFSLEKVDVDCLITKSANTLFIKGSFSALIDTCCSRCLENVKLPIGSDFAYTLVPAKTETVEDLELKPEELEINYYQGDFIDLAPMICEQIILQVPIKVLCKKECRGLCPQCGTDLNNALCDCSDVPLNDRMAVLKNFVIKK
jgi:uncharacterized protein